MCRNSDKLLRKNFRPLTQNKTITVSLIICFVKKLLTASLIVILFNSTYGLNLDSFFKSVVSNGLVNYSLIKTEKKSELDSLINDLNTKIASSPTKANYINLYNQHVINEVVKKYPVSCPTAIPGFFETNKVLIGKELSTLNNLENKIIRPTYNDPRVHFALVCGAKGCPPIQTFAYSDSTLDSLLTKVTKEAINNKDFIKAEGAAKVSEIFKW